MVPTVLAMVVALGAGQAPTSPGRAGATCGDQILPPDIVLPSGIDTWKPPFVVEVHGPEDPRPGTTIEIRVEIERNLVEETPLTISLGLPSGVELVEGPMVERVVDGSSPQIVRAFALRIVGSIPEEDVTVTVEQKGEGWGAHAAKAYGFGRVEHRPLDAGPRRGAPVDLGGGLIVHPVQVD